MTCPITTTGAHSDGGDPPEGTDAWINDLFDSVDRRHSEGRFAESDAYLRDLDVSTLDTYRLVAVLSITLPASGELSGRAAFVERARARLLEIAPDRVDELLRGLE